jgi:hypothetical protein
MLLDPPVPGLTGVHEPATITLFGLGLVAPGISRRRAQQRKRILAGGNLPVAGPLFPAEFPQAITAETR